MTVAACTSRRRQRPGGRRSGDEIDIEADVEEADSFMARLQRWEAETFVKVDEIGMYCQS
jgi:hypothetical protein